MGTFTFARESIRGLWPELWPLLFAHWEEIATWSDIPMDPDREAYEAIEDAGLLRLYTARNAQGLVGYAAYVVRTHLHYRGSVQAVQDVVYLRPEYRQGRIGQKLLEAADADLASEGVQVVFQHVKLAHNFGPLLERLGYEHLENVYARRLDR